MGEQLDEAMKATGEGGTGKCGTHCRWLKTIALFCFLRNTCYFTLIIFFP